jgi:UDP-N-acetylmuramyl pentapeptide phosphotransferase/UDP-N-acetylglucosamine-1-phosphate transferase
MLSATAFAVSAANRWLLAVSFSALIVLLGCVRARRAGRRHSAARTLEPLTESEAPAGESTDGTAAGETNGGDRARRRRGTRRRAGALIAIGPVVGLLLGGSLDELAVVLALGAAGLALVGIAIERAENSNRAAIVATMVAAAAAVAAGARFGPTGVGALDVVCAFAFVIAVTKSVDGMGNADGLAPGLGAVTALALFAVAAFAHQNALATVLVGLTAACVAFLAFNVRPASLFAGRGGRLVIGYSLAVGALAVDPVPGSGRSLVTPLVILAVFVLDATVVVVYRMRRRRPLTEHRGDHLIHRLGAIGWTTNEAVLFLIVMEIVLAVTTVFVARAVLSVWLGAAVAAGVVLVVGLEARRATLDRDHAVGFSKPARIVIGLGFALVVFAVVPLGLAALQTVNLMQDGRTAAVRALQAARDGDTVTARASFEEAARNFAQARDKLEAPTMAGGPAVPFLASNVNAARALAEIGTDLANAGGSLTAAVDPDKLEVVDGTLPLGEVAKITPAFERGSAALNRSLERIDRLRRDPYLVPPVRDAIDKVRTQLARAAREADRTTAAAKLAPSIFGGSAPRTYLLVVQNNAESRATGGFIGSYGLITAQNGKLHVSDLLRTNSWNQAVRAQPDLKLDAPADYLARYAQFQPGTTLQNINLSPDFPSVAQALTGLAPQAGQPKIDGVIAVDPAGLAALMELTGPVQVAAWPDPIGADNVVNVTLRDAYAAYERTPERADFLGDVAHAAVDKATTGKLGRPTKIAKVLGKAAHSGHLTIAFSRPDEQRLAEQLGVAQEMGPVRSDAIAVTSSNAAGNKIDYYLQRAIDYRVTVHPDDSLHSAQATADLSVVFDNKAPATGLPEGVIGPFDPRFVAGENRSFVSLYSPLAFTSTKVNGKATAVSPGRERGRNVYSRFTDLLSKAQETTSARLVGAVALHDGWYSVEVRHQATLNPDRVRVAVDVPEGWRIDQAPGMARPFSRRASVDTLLEQTTTYRVHIVRDPGTWELWQRLKAGT